MYTLIKAGIVSKIELEEYYTLDEFLKLYALWQMQKDMEAYKADEAKKKAKKGR